LGKGHVDDADIQRLNKVIEWLPGKCAYCNGLGKVPESMLKTVAVDETYLVNSLSEEERERILNRDEGELEKMAAQKIFWDILIQKVLDWHINEDLLSWEITDKLIEEGYAEEENCDEVESWVSGVLREYGRS
jgi:hypothetical protein